MTFDEDISNLGPTIEMYFNIKQVDSLMKEILNTMNEVNKSINDQISLKKLDKITSKLHEFNSEFKDSTKSKIKYSTSEFVESLKKLSTDFDTFKPDIKNKISAETSSALTDNMIVKSCEKLSEEVNLFINNITETINIITKIFDIKLDKTNTNQDTNQVNINTDQEITSEQKELIDKIDKMLKDNIDENDSGGGSIPAYPMLYTRTFYNDFGQGFIPSIFEEPLNSIGSAVLKYKHHPNRFVDSQLDSIFHRCIAIIGNGEYIYIGYSFNSEIYAKEHNIEIREVKADVDDRYRKGTREYFSDSVCRRIYCLSGYVVSIDEINKKGIPIINHKMCFDIYMDFQKKHFYDAIPQNIKSKAQLIKCESSSNS